MHRLTSLCLVPQVFPFKLSAKVNLYDKRLPRMIFNGKLCTYFNHIGRDLNPGLLGHQNASRCSTTELSYLDQKEWFGHVSTPFLVIPSFPFFCMSVFLA